MSCIFGCLPGCAIPDYPSSFSAENAALPVTWPETSYRAEMAPGKLHGGCCERHVHLFLPWMTWDTDDCPWPDCFYASCGAVWSWDCGVRTDGFSMMAPFFLSQHTKHFELLKGQQKHQDATYLHIAFIAKKKKTQRHDRSVDNCSVWTPVTTNSSIFWQINYQ